MQREADRFGISLPDAPIDSDDYFAAKIDLLRADPVPIVSFTFGIPGREVIRDLQQAGSTVVQTVTSRAEARAAAAGVDALAVQANVAGGHSGTLTPEIRRRQSPSLISCPTSSRAVGLPVIAAGGLGTADDVAAVLHAGARAAAVGTVLLLADESGASATHQAALQDPARTEPSSPGPSPDAPRVGCGIASSTPTSVGAAGLSRPALPHQPAAQGSGRRRRTRPRAPVGRHRISAGPPRADRADPDPTRPMSSPGGPR